MLWKILEVFFKKTANAFQEAEEVREKGINWLWADDLEEAGFTCSLCSAAFCDARDKK